MKFPIVSPITLPRWYHREVRSAGLVLVIAIAATAVVRSAPTPPATKITLAEAGVEAAALDRTMDPCVDFYQFACGGWLAANQIPADRARWNRFTELEDKLEPALKALLEEDAKGIGGDPTAKRLGDYYASCMDEAALEKAGTAPLHALLDRLAKVKDNASWLAAIVELHKLGVWVVFRAGTGAALPDNLDAYKDHVRRLLAAVGTLKAEDELAVETELAKLAGDPTPVELDAKALAKQAKSIDWKAYYKGLGVAPGAKIAVDTKRLAALDGLRKKLKPAQWSAYFTYQLLLHESLALPKALDEEAFLHDKLARGVAAKPARYKRCIEATTSALGELVGRQYVDKYLPAASRQAAIAQFDALLAALGDEVGVVDWLGDASRKTVRERLGQLVRMIGYPDKWRTYDFEVKRDDFAGNRLRAAASEVRRVLARAGKPVDRSEWRINTFDVEPYYSVAANAAALPAGVLQRPFFAPERSVAANLGGLGFAIGPSLVHALDAATLPKDDAAKYETKAKCVAQMYDSFEALPKQFVSGQRTATEDIADLGGIKLAYRAYRSLRKDASRAYIADGFSEDQIFFIAVAQAACGKDRKEELERRLKTDPQAPAKFRIYGALRNLPELAQAFSCAAGTPMRPAQTCSVW